MGKTVAATKSVVASSRGTVKAVRPLAGGDVSVLMFTDGASHAEVARLSAVRASRRRQLRRARTLLRARAEAQAAVRGALLRLQLRR